MSASATATKAAQGQRKGAVTSTRPTMDMSNIDGYDKEDTTQLKAKYGESTRTIVRQQPTFGSTIAVARRSQLQTMKVTNEESRRQLNTTVKSQREMRAEIRGTAEKQFSALTAKIQKSQNIVRGDIRNLTGQVKQSFLNVKKQMDSTQQYLQKMDAANQQRFLALQRDMLAINQQIANNHKQITDLVNQRARETQQAIIQQLDARIQEVKQLQIQLANQLQGQISAELQGMQDALGQQIQQQGQQIQSQIAAVDQKVDAIAQQLGALGKELEKRALELAKQGEELVTIYTCNICGGRVHNAGCASTNDPNSRVSFKIKKSEFLKLKNMGKISDNDTTDLGSGEVGYRIFIGSATPDAEGLKQVLRAAGVNI
jgi:hypothetical protein